MNIGALMIGLVLIVIGVSVIFLAFGDRVSGESKFGVSGFIGPIPFGLGNSPKMVWLAIGLSIIAIIVFLIVNKVVSG